MNQAPNQWYVQFDGQSYGPFTYAQMQGFVNEGRVVSDSLITSDLSRGFYQASGFPAFLHWLSTSQSIQQMNPVQQPAYAQNQYQVQTHYQPQTQHQEQVQYQDPYQAHYQAHSQAMGQAQAVNMAMGQSYTPAPSEAQMQAPAMSVFLVMAEIRSEQAMPFLAKLQTYGAAQRIGDTVWVIKGVATAETLRDGLGSILTKQDRLFVLDCFNNQTSWFNIGADMDSRIRQIWDIES